MTLQNRVDPFGEIRAVPERGTLMGNRGGRLHDERQRLGRSRWTSRRWIACLLEFKGRRRALMQPGRYTELFFLDEATALAAGHRPCAECRRPAFEAFRSAFAEAPGGGEPPRADAMDVEMHEARVRRDRSKLTWSAGFADLPDGVLFARGTTREQAWLVWRGHALRWSFGGYTTLERPSGDEPVRVLTPRPIARVLRHGYAADLHPSARTLF